MISIRKQISLCAIGTLLEWYDFSLFACLAPILAKIFFQHSDPFTGMMGTFAIFASGYVMRPLGAFVFGKMGDQFGRKYSLLITIFTMTVATTAIGFIPTGSNFATLFLVICRLAQGFACSGEYPGILTLLSEQPAVKRKAFVISTGVFATGMGGVLGASVYMILHSILGDHSMYAWGWRILFLLGAPLGIVGYLLRKYIDESSEFTRIKEKNLISRAPILDLFRYHSPNFFAALCISILTNTVIYIDYIYVGNYALSIHKINSSQVVYAALLVSLAYGFSSLFFGYLADVLDKKILLIGGCIISLFCTYPLFQFMMTGTVLQQFVGQIILVLLLGSVMASFTSILGSLFPAEVRYSGFSLTLNLAASIFGGTAPIVCSWLVKTTGQPTMPAFYIMIFAFLALVSAIKLSLKGDNRLSNLAYESA